MAKTCRYKFLVIDNQDLLEINNLQRKVNPAVKHPEPIFKMDASWDTEEDMFNYLNVLYDEKEKLFRMWYDVTKHVKNQYNEGGRMTAYAVSRDGIHWEKPIMNMVEVNGSKENNYIIPFMGSLTYTIIDDGSDIPERRYKMIFQVKSAGGLFTGGGRTGGNETQWAEFHIPLCLAYSADGIRWERPAHVNPVLRGISDGGWGFLYDPDRRKYQLYTRRVPNLPRDISLYESYDLVNWEDLGRVLVPGDEYDPPELFNFQGMTPFLYEEFCLGLLNTQYSLPGAEYYEVYNKPPAGYPTADLLGKVDVQLAYSRDGRNWMRPKDRTPLLANGEYGSPDAGTIFVPSSNPFTVNGETWIYYFSYPLRHNSWSQLEELERVNGDNRKLSFGMLAKMPEDHWVSLDAGSTEGSFTCKPWGPPHEVFINADILPGGSIEVELVTPYGKTMPGYSRSECIPMTRSGKHAEIKWKNGRHPWDFQREQLGGILPKFYLKNAKLYSYSFTLPDPDGQLERDRLNARWCEHIKHRSDNWGRKSNEPGRGLPPHVGPGPTDI